LFALGQTPKYILPLKACVDQYVRLNSTVNDSECIRHYFWTNSDSGPNFTVEYNNTKTVYRGQLKRGLPHGWGTYIDKNYGYDYTGEFKQNEADGFGTFHWKSNITYKGFVRKTEFHRYGYYIFSNGVISADWEGMEPNLDKFINLRDGSKYRGGMRWRLQHGMGEHIFQDGSYYKGNYNLG
jgi:hypothetical protein